MKELKYKIYISSPDSILVSFELNNSNIQTIGIIKNIKKVINNIINQKTYLLKLYYYNIA